ncbi:hypothetical protein BH23PSE1_BH23PSE1_05190 [soil metagenome]
MFRGPENALPPNWLHIPIGYNGRASTVVASGTDIRRPLGQTKAPDAQAPSFGPSERLDIELEMVAVVGIASLREPGPMNHDIALTVTMQAEGGAPTTITRTNARELYYSFAQQLAHHTSSGCSMSTGDLLGSGTISGPQKGSSGSLLELSRGGKEPLTLEGGATRTFIADGDTLTLHGHAQGDGFRVGFGECSGTILPSPRFPQ